LTSQAPDPRQPKLIIEARKPGSWPGSWKDRIVSDRILRLHHVGMVVQDLEASVAWYRDHLGFQHQYDFSFPGVQATMTVRGDARLEFFRVEGAEPMTPERQEFQTSLRIGGINHLALAVDDLDEAVAALKADGVEIVIPPSNVPNASGDRYAFIRDNERMLVELFKAAV
jgi:catechol 2,3-dioxygenase-like lactoylglutathione lyase family enzyme